MSNRSNAIARSRATRQSFEHLRGSAGNVIISREMNTEELRVHLMNSRSNYRPGKRKDDRRGGGCRNRWA